MYFFYMYICMYMEFKDMGLELEQIKQALRKKCVFVNKLERETYKGNTCSYSSAFLEWLSNKTSYREWSGYKATASRSLPL